MKLFKKIYFPIVALLVVLATVFGAITASAQKTDFALKTDELKTLNGYIEKISEKTTAYDRGEYIRTTLRGDSGADIQDKEGQLTYYTGDNTQSSSSKASFKLDSEGKPLPTIVRHRATINPTLTEEGYYVNYEVVNYVVVFPGSDTIAKHKAINDGTDSEALKFSDATLLVIPYDLDGEEKIGNSVAVASAIMEIERFKKSEVTPVNDMIFLFAAGGENGKMGATAFIDQFKGYDDIYSRVKTVVTFDVVGSNPAVLVGETKGDAAITTAILKSGGKAYASSIAAELLTEVNDFDAFEGLSGVEITSLDNNTAGTIHDNSGKTNNDLINGVYSFVRGAINYLSSANLSKSDGKIADAYFNYFGATVAYSAVLPYVLGGVIALLLAAIVYFAITKKSFCFINLAKGAATSVLSIVASVACSAIALLIIGLIGSGFGVVDIHSLFTVVKANVGIILFAITLAITLAVIFYSLAKKLLKVENGDIVRGNSFIVAIIAIITCYVAPYAAHLTAFAAVVMLAITLVEALLKNIIKEKTGEDIEKLYLNIIPAALMMPLILSEAFGATSVAPLAILPVITFVTLLIFGGVTPYLGELALPISKLVGRIFKRTVIIEKTVNGELKKGKKTVSLGYSNAFGVTVTALLCTVAISLFALLGNIGFGTGSVTNYASYDTIYKDALVYVVDGDKTHVEISDTEVYKYVSPYADGFKWDARKGAYVLQNAPKLEAGALTIKADENNARKFVVNSLEKADYDYKVALTGFTAGSITKVIFNAGSNETYKREYDVTADNSSELTFIVPKDYGSDENGNSFTLEIEGEATAVSVAVERRSDDIQNKQNNALWQVVSFAYSDNALVYENLRINLITKAAAEFALA